MTQAIIGFAAVLALGFAGVPLGFAMLFVGTIGFAIQRGSDAAFSALAQLIIDASASYSLSVLPMFILMGIFIHRSRISDELFETAQAWVGHWRGGLAHATVAASAVFGLITGSSIAAAATMAKVAIPQMRSRGYADRISSGCVAASGVLGMLIPPSVPLMIYGLITDTDIRKLFIGVVGPGILVAILFGVGVMFLSWRRPQDMPAGDPKLPLIRRIRALRGVAATLVLFVVVIGGIYVGLMTVTEAAGIGCAGALAIVLWRRSLDLKGILSCAVEAGLTTSMIFLVIFGAGIFANFINLSGLTGFLSRTVASSGLGPVGLLLLMGVVYLLLGCILETIGLMLLTVPIFLPLAMAVGIDPIFFGIFVVLMIEIGLLTPPIGMNVFMVKSVVPDLRLTTIFSGVMPFVLLNILAVLLIILLPGIVLTPLGWF